MIYEHLGTGKESARSARELAEVLHVDVQSVYEQIKKERGEGKPICATCNRYAPGYYLAADRQEMLAYCIQLQHRATVIIDSVKVCSRIMNLMKNANGEE